MDKKLKDKLRKLQAMIEDKGASEGEVYNASKLMVKLLEKHNLSIKDVDLTYHEVDDLGVPTISSKNDGPWEKQLIVVITEHNLCQAYFSRGYGANQSAHQGILHILGTETNVELVKAQLDVIRVKFLLLSKVRVREAKKENPGMNKNKYKRDYLVGSVRGLSNALEAQKQKTIQADTGEYGLMVTKHNSVIEEYKEKELNLIRTRGRKVRRNSDAFNTGYNDGQGTTTQRAIS